jgi:outer membrane protein assembly factor BamB
LTKMKSETIANVVTLILMFAMVISLVAIPSAKAQDLIMNVTGPVLIHSEVDIDLNGPSIFIENVTLWVKYPGRADFTYIGGYPTTDSGDLDVYDFDFNETGDFELKWALPPDFTVESNVVTVESLTVDMLPPRTTYAFIGALPNPVGVGQEVLLHVGITQQLTNVAYGWEGLTVTVEKPDGKTETIGPFRTDATGGTGTVYVPTMAGNYILQTHFPEQRSGEGKVGGGTPSGTLMLASDSEKLTLVVQAEPLEYYPGSPLPTEYWTRPINAQHREWYQIAGSSWQSDEYNDAPEAPHVLWTKPLTIGGLVGGDTEVQSFEHGDAYEGKWPNRIILAGRLYYTAGPYERPNLIHCVDLRTGEELWAKTFLDDRTISFGQLIYWDSYNYHGVFEYLWVTVGNTWYGFDSFTGELISQYNNVPSGTNIYGDKGEIYRYTIDLNDARMLLWNQSAMVSMQGSWGSAHDNRVGSRALDASDPSRYDRSWALNISIPTGLPGDVRAVKLGDKVVGVGINSQSLYRSEFVGVKDVTVWAFSLKPGQEGQLLYKKTWNAPAGWAAGNISSTWRATDLDANIGLIWNKETRLYYGFNLETGDYLWESEVAQNYLDIYSTGARIAYGKLYSVGQSGHLYCFDTTDGKLLWIYNSTDPYSEFLWGNNWSTDIDFISGGKVYMFHSEHSPVNPLFRGAPMICLNATTGEEIYRVDGLFRKTDWGGDPIMGDSVIAGYNSYDQRVYAFGKGPSATTTSIQDDVTTYGKSVLVKGTVTDVSPGTKDSAVSMRFPNGVPAVSDDSVGEWMKYVYQQFERPKNATGVEVVVSVLDPNNNYYEVGRTTSDSTGMFGVAFTPEVPGKYTVIASFEGSAAYYGSFAETIINVEEAPTASPEPTSTPISVADLYLVPGIAGIIIAIAVVGAILVLMLRKR